MSPEERFRYFCRAHTAEQAGMPAACRLAECRRHRECRKRAGETDLPFCMRALPHRLLQEVDDIVDEATRLFAALRQGRDYTLAGRDEARRALQLDALWVVARFYSSPDMPPALWRQLYNRHVKDERSPHGDCVMKGKRDNRPGGKAAAPVAGASGMAGG